MEPTQELISGNRIRLRANPGKIGVYTGKNRNAGGFLLYEIEFGPNEKPFVRVSQLERVPDHEDMYDLFNSGRFGGPSDLARLLVTTKLAGDITNVYYSMGVGNTDFLPHQFKPVLKFIESMQGRLLLADEVGLGKTIESVYIWKELQAREGSRRLLVVCPSMLRDKWKRDLEVRFGIEATIVDAKELLERVQGAIRNPSAKSFVLIVSLEGIRTRVTDWDTFSAQVRPRLCGTLEETADRNSDPVFDLVIIDEAHYLRNASTASHQTAGLLRDNASKLVLLSATPIQTSDENLFNLLRLLSPEEYTNYETFKELATLNASLIELENSIRYKGDVEAARQILSKAGSYGALLDPQFVLDMENQLAADTLGAEERVDLSRRIGERSFFSPLISRTRKRDVFENRVIRVAETFKFKFSEYEQWLYNSVTQFLRSQSRSSSTLSVFALISRQRQMTSCLPAAFKHWRDHDSMSESLWEDLGLEESEDGSGKPKEVVDIGDLPFDVEHGRLEQGDSKYAELASQLGILLGKDAREKVIIFSFYRGTISYLQRRLSEDGFKVQSIKGGMGDEKYKIIDEFASPTGPNILISSEVGAEGIDLQFCHIIVNYDLPWNPMKLEQRIGRVDRIGQHSERIFIYNMTCVNTIEDNVLTRLYDRIDIFTTSIGDLEDILGETVERLALDLIDPNLTSAEREHRAEQNIMAVVQKRKLRNELEDKALDLFGFSDYIIRSINDAQDLNRFVVPGDTLTLVEEFFSSRFPGTRIIPHLEQDSRLIRLSPAAKTAFSDYLDRVHSPIQTMLSRSDSDILCLFNPKVQPERGSLSMERVDIIHPLIQWIVEENERRIEDRHPCSAICLSSLPVGTGPGIYAYTVQVWSAEGWKAKKELRFFAARTDGTTLDSKDAEKLVVAAFRLGKTWRDWNDEMMVAAIAPILDAVVSLGFTQYGSFETAFLAENTQICDKQVDYAVRTAARKSSETKALIDRLALEGKTRVIPMHRSRLSKIESQLEMQRGRVAKYRNAFTNNRELAIGIIKAGE